MRTRLKVALVHAVAFAAGVAVGAATSIVLVWFGAGGVLVAAFVAGSAAGFTAGEYGVVHGLALGSLPAGVLAVRLLWITLSRLPQAKWETGSAFVIALLAGFSVLAVLAASGGGWVGERMRKALAARRADVPGTS